MMVSKASIFASYVSAFSVIPRSIILPVLNDTPDVGVNISPMVDQSRLDPFTNFTQPREVLVSVFYPAEVASSELPLDQQSLSHGKASLLPYMPLATAVFWDSVFSPYGLPGASLEQISTKCQLHAPISKQQTQYRLLVFSPGGGISRLFYTTMLEELARLGYAVVAIDHPYDSLIVEFPDGHIVQGGFEEIDTDLLALLVKTRAQDVSFVIDELSSEASIYPFELNTTHVVAFGHSLGGATAAQAALTDTRIQGGMNIDGRLFRSLKISNTTLSKSFLQFQSEESAAGPPWNWDEDWQHLSGWKLQLLLEGAQHATLTDMPLIVEELGLRERWGREGEKLLGTLNGRRGLEIIVAYVQAFADYVLMDKKGPLLNGSGSGQFSEVKVIRHS